MLEMLQEPTLEAFMIILGAACYARNDNNGNDPFELPTAVAAKLCH
jgi:hypothetical protein